MILSIRWEPRSEEAQQVLTACNRLKPCDTPRRRRFGPCHLGPHQGDAQTLIQSSANPFNRGRRFWERVQLQVARFFGGRKFVAATSILLARGGGPSCTAATNSGPTSEPSVPQESFPVPPSRSAFVELERVPSLATVRQFVDDGYCPHQRVNCPCCRGERRYFFLLVQVGPGRIRVDRLDPQRPIVGDPNPSRWPHAGVPALVP